MHQHHCKVFVIIMIMINNNNIMISTNIALLQEDFQCCMVCSYFLDVQILSKNQNGITQSALDQFTPNQNPFLLYIMVEDVSLQPIERTIVAIGPKLDLKLTSTPIHFMCYVLLHFSLWIPLFFNYSIVIIILIAVALALALASASTLYPYLLSTSSSSSSLAAEKCRSSL